MKINLAKSAGFCFGVKRAINIALRTAKSRKDVCMLGDIVHNEDVVRQMELAGITKIRKLDKTDTKTLLIRAHGACKYIENKALSLGYRIVDATCPMVKEIHRIAQRMENAGYKVIIIGDKKHDEVHGIVGQLKKRALVIDTLQNLPYEKIKKINKAAIVAQSTQNIAKVIKIVDKLKSYIKEIKFYNTICKPTQTKQQEIMRMPLENDAMIIIGSKSSANTRRLYEISKSLNKRSYWVHSKKQIKASWFKNASSVGVTAGSSTPDSVTQGIIEYIKQIT